MNESIVFYMGLNDVKNKIMNDIQLKIYRDLLDDLLSGRLKPGDILPGERELARAYGTHTMNGKAAVNLLAHRGLVWRKRHAGTMVCKDLDLALIRELRDSGKKLAILLTSNEPTGIHWNEETVDYFMKRAKEYGFQVLHREMPTGFSELSRMLILLSALNPEAAVILDDNFDHDNLFRCRDAIRRFPHPAVRLNRFGSSMPLNTPNTISVDIDHFENGYQAGLAAASSGIPDPVVVSYNSQSDDHSRWLADRIRGINCAFLDSGCASPKSFCCSEANMLCLAENIRSAKNGLILALNLEIAASIHDTLLRCGLKCPQDYRMIGVDDLHQYDSYQISTVAVSKTETGLTLADLACGRLIPESIGKNCSVRLSGTLLKRKTF